MHCGMEWGEKAVARILSVTRPEPCCWCSPWQHACPKLILQTFLKIGAQISTLKCEELYILYLREGSVSREGFLEWHLCSPGHILLLMHKVKFSQGFSTFLNFPKISSSIFKFCFNFPQNSRTFLTAAQGILLLMHEVEVSRDGDHGHGVHGDAAPVWDGNDEDGGCDGESWINWNCTSLFRLNIQ